MSQAVDTLKLNIGGRSTHIPGFKSVDINPDVGADIIDDVADLKLVLDGSVQEIYASHVLEHFPHPKTVDVLKTWRRVLVPGGKLYVSVPDFDAVVRLYTQSKMLTDYMVNTLYGDQIYKEAFHYTAFTWGRLRAALDAAGFTSARRIDQMPYNVKDCSRLVNNWDFTLMSVNAEAVA